MKQRRIGVYVMIDGLGFAFLRENELLPEFEFRVGLRTVLGDSHACAPTLLTGRLPHEHGHAAMFQRANGSTPLAAAQRYAWLPPVVRDHQRIRDRIHDAVAERIDGRFSLADCPTHLLAEFDLTEHHSIFQPGAMRHGPNIFDRFEELALRHRRYGGEVPEEENVLRAEDDLRRGDLELLFLRLPALGGLLREHGSVADAVLAHLSWYEERVRHLRELAEDAAEEVELFVCSAHGTSDVHGAVDLIAEVERDFGRNGRRYLAFYDPTMVRFWCEDRGLLDELRGALGDRHDGRCIHDEEKAELGIAFTDRSQGDLHFVVNEGLLILPSYRGHSLFAGMHGYHPDAVGADGCLLGNFSPSLDPTHIRHVHDLMDATAGRLVAERV